MWAEEHRPDGGGRGGSSITSACFLLAAGISEVDHEQVGSGVVHFNLTRSATIRQPYEACTENACCNLAGIFLGGNSGSSRPCTWSLEPWSPRVQYAPHESPRESPVPRGYSTGLSGEYGVDRYSIIANFALRLKLVGNVHIAACLVSERYAKPALI